MGITKAEILGLLILWISSCSASNGIWQAAVSSRDLLAGQALPDDLHEDLHMELVQTLAVLISQAQYSGTISQEHAYYVILYLPCKGT